MALFGGTGTGKSTSLVNMAAAALAAVTGITAVDPHGRLAFVGEGIYPIEASRVFSANDNVALDQRQIKQMTVSGKVEVIQIPGVIVSRFEVATRGRAIQSLVEFPDGTSVVMQELILPHRG